MLGCIEDAEKITGDMDLRNVLAHLHFATNEDIRRMAETGSVTTIPPLWTAAIPGFYDIEVKYVGADAQINLARGVVVTNAQLTPTSAEIAKAGAEFFGPDGRHAYDYMYYYNNIKDNAAKRVTAYLNNRT